jgi:hypothetical protein
MCYTQPHNVIGATLTSSSFEFNMNHQQLRFCAAQTVRRTPVLNPLIAPHLCACVSNSPDPHTSIALLPARISLYASLNHLLSVVNKHWQHIRRFRCHPPFEKRRQMIYFTSNTPPNCDVSVRVDDHGQMPSKRGTQDLYHVANTPIKQRPRPNAFNGTHNKTTISRR